MVNGTSTAEWYDRRAGRVSHPLHLFAAAAPRILVPPLAGCGSLRDLDLTPTVRIGTAIAFAFLQCHSTYLLGSGLQFGEFARFDRLHEDVPLSRAELHQVALFTDADLSLIDLD